MGVSLWKRCSFRSSPYNLNRFFSMNRIISYNLENIRQAAAQFITYMEGRNVFTFDGLMGVGKTTFIKAVCEELGVTDVINSPTFSIINEYKTSSSLIYHFDFYRINKINEAREIGVEDYFFSGHLCFIEWSEIIQSFLPENTVFVSIKEQPDGSRLITM